MPEQVWCERCGAGTLTEPGWGHSNRFGRWPRLPRGWEWSSTASRSPNVWCPICIGRLLDDTLTAMAGARACRDSNQQPAGMPR